MMKAKMLMAKRNFVMVGMFRIIAPFFFINSRKSTKKSREICKKRPF